MANARTKRTHILGYKLWSDSEDQSLKLREWYGTEYCRRFKTRSDCKCGGHSRNNKKLTHHGHYMRYSYRLLRRAKMAERDG